MHLGEGKLAQSEAFFERHGPKTVFIARFISVVRSVSAYLAGINQMSPRTFAIYNLAGGLTWAVVIGSLGYIFGKNLHLIEAILRQIGGVLAAVLLVGAVVLWLNYRWRQSERNYLSGRIGVTLSWLQAQWQQIIFGGQRRRLLYGLLVLVSGWPAYVWGRRHEWSSQVNAGAAVAFVIAGISIAGLYLAQAHLSDVLAGLSIGLLWLGIPLALANTESGSDLMLPKDDAAEKMTNGR